MSQGPAIGDPGPAFELPDTDGEEHSFGEPSPDVPATVVYWTCNHCPYALAWHDRLLEVARDYDSSGARFLAINSNDGERYPADSIHEMTERVHGDDGWPHPYLHDETQDVAYAFGAKKTPDIFVFDSDLLLAYRGAPDGDYEDPRQHAAWLRAALDAVIEGREPDTQETEPVGCGIKWKE